MSSKPEITHQNKHYGIHPRLGCRIRIKDFINLIRKDLYGELLVALKSALIHKIIQRIVYDFYNDIKQNM